MKTIVYTLLLVFITATTYAGCWYDGKEYPVGSKKGSKVCAHDGYWR